MSDIAERFAQLIRNKHKWREPYGTELARKMPTDKLKKLWDSYDGAETSDPNISGEAVHLVLNERKEGSYCAV